MLYSPLRSVFNQEIPLSNHFLDTEIALQEGLDNLMNLAVTWKC